MKYFSVPADFKKETIDKYDILNRSFPESKVIETYGNITVGNLCESGRAVNDLPRVDFQGLKAYVEYSQAKDIDFNYTLNPSHMNNREFSRKGILELMTFLDKLYDAGVRSLTIALPTIIDLVKASPYDFKIKPSTICQIVNATKALAYKRMGVERIVVDEAVYKDFQTLRRIRNAFGEKVEIIINSICHKNCIYRPFHYNQVSSDSIQVNQAMSLNYYSNKCLMQRYQTISDFLKLSWVRPEDLKYYTDIGINYFKLQGRQHVSKGDPLRTLEAYFKESYDGDLMKLLDMFNPTCSFRFFVDNKKLEGFIKPFYEIDGFCKNDCASCKYCETFARKAIDYSEAERVIALANNYFEECDSLEKVAVTINQSNTGDQSDRHMEADFDLD